MDAGGQVSEEVRRYVEASFKKTELERQESKEKTGVDSGTKVINPMTGEAIPLWVADYVLGHYGTGSIMAVPAHDGRDFEFARKFRISIKRVVSDDSDKGNVPKEYKERPLEYFEIVKPEDFCLTSPGVLVNSGQFTGMSSEEAKIKIVDELQKNGLAEPKKNYRLHDWILSRQRYWGAPIPMIRCEDCGYVPVPEDQLPVKLPSLESYLPADDGRSPLARAEKWLKVKCPQCSKWAERETDTMDTFVDSSWYYLRYADPKNETEFAAKEKMSRWLPIPLYFGGAEHNTMHLLYSRFITKALCSLNLVDFSEPFLGRRNHGFIMDITTGEKMSKSRGQAVDPDEQVQKYGADTVRMYFAFLGPYDQNYFWNFESIQGVHRFLNRVWDFVGRSSDKKLPEKDSREINIALNRTVKEVGEQIRQHKFNTGVSALMKLLNELEKLADGGKLSQEQYSLLVKILAPYAPHIAEELWQSILGHDTSVHLESWPEYDKEILAQEKVSVVVQVNGKMRGTLEVERGLPEEEVRSQALASDKVIQAIAGAEVKKTIYVQDRLINFVI
jgi:leucyl-tRNA synthetase